MNGFTKSCSSEAGRKRSLFPLDNDEARIVRKLGKAEKVRLDLVEDLLRREMLHLTNLLFEMIGKVMLGSSGVIEEAIGVEHKDVAGPHKFPFVQLIPVLESQDARSSAAVDDIAGGQSADRRKRRTESLADFHEPVL